LAGNRDLRDHFRESPSRNLIMIDALRPLIRIRCGCPGDRSREVLHIDWTPPASFCHRCCRNSLNQWDSSHTPDFPRETRSGSQDKAFKEFGRIGTDKSASVRRSPRRERRHGGRIPRPSDDGPCDGATHGLALMLTSTHSRTADVFRGPATVRLNGTLPNDKSFN
jgi:hypothetical protein